MATAEMETVMEAEMEADDFAVPDGDNLAAEAGGEDEAGEWGYDLVDKVGPSFL